MFLIFIITGYCLPTLIAAMRGHNSAMAIAFVDIALGWTGFGWLFAMVWALTGNVRDRESSGFLHRTAPIGRVVDYDDVRA